MPTHPGTRSEAPRPTASRPLLLEPSVSDPTPDLPRPELVTTCPEWSTLRAGIRSALASYVRALHPRPGLYAALWNDPTEHRARYLLTLATERAVADHLDDLAVVAGQWAIHYGATPEDLAAVDGSTPAEAAQRYAIPDEYRGHRFMPQHPDWINAQTSDDAPDPQSSGAQANTNDADSGRQQ